MGNEHFNADSKLDTFGTIGIFSCHGDCLAMHSFSAGKGLEVDTEEEGP